MSTFDTVQLGIISGVISGILTAVIIRFLYLYITKVLVPWFESIVYKGIIVSGNWKSTVLLGTLGFKAELKIMLEQKGHKLKGDMVAVYINPDGNSNKTKRLELEGFLANHYLSITYNSSSRNSISLGTFLLKVVHGGEQLKGGMLSLDGITSDVQNYKDIIWERE
ncbi:hypothetical protein [Desulfosporosinus sp. OT]|uniref:hypothetical protein n=1 Tax=Desulfosporosinus sp. OT TaxID=913865 RepID=UPI0002239D9E|nr:hypothetical protein [Desulfosporosinus sp. OT]EGW36013.1 hypothetical protein DOT_6121 [Desulfosporosinus sp. OT]